MTSPFRFSSWLPLAVLLVSVLPSVASAQGIKKGARPLQTARGEIKDFREAYAKAYNEKDSTTVADMYAPDAILIEGDGTVLVGQDAIRKEVAADAARWPQMTITSDTLRVVGSTAWDVGTTHSQRSGGGDDVSHYLVILRRGMTSWKINRLAVVPESHTASAADSAAKR
jgi:ketosteroid isomerase-like protein